MKFKFSCNRKEHHYMTSTSALLCHFGQPYQALSLIAPQAQKLNLTTIQLMLSLLPREYASSVSFLAALWGSCNTKQAGHQIEQVSAGRLGDILVAITVCN